MLEHNKSVSKLDLSGTGMGDSSAKVLVEALAFNPALTSIDLSFNTVRVQTVFGLSHLRVYAVSTNFHA
jgi:hypothetical protein